MWAEYLKERQRPWARYKLDAVCACVCMRVHVCEVDTYIKLVNNVRHGELKIEKNNKVKMFSLNNITTSTTIENTCTVWSLGVKHSPYDNYPFPYSIKFT